MRYYLCLGANTVNGSQDGERSGAHTLALLALPLNCLILRALAEGSRPQAELRRIAGFPAQTTLRAQLKRLGQIGAIAKFRRDRFPGALEYELLDAGRELLDVAVALERWLKRSPGGPLEPDGSTAKAAIKALVEGWSTSMLRALAVRPFTLTELDGMIASLNYPSLERRLGAMRLAGQVEVREGDGRGTPYGVTDWARQAMAPIVAAARWERRHLADSAPPIVRVDAEAAFLLSMPLLRLPADVSGSVRMAADLPRAHQVAGVLVSVNEGRIASCSTRLEGYPDAWASGSPPAWMAAVIDGDVSGLELGGDGGLVRTLLEEVHGTLFGSKQRSGSV